MSTLALEVGRLPVIPKDVLRKYRVYEAGDTPFKAAARLSQALWREERGLPMGRFKNANTNSRQGESQFRDARNRGTGAP